MVSSGGRGTAGSGPSGRVTPAGRHGRSRGRWDLADGDAESVLAEARKAFFVMAGFLAVIWLLQIANWADHYRITLDYGIRPRDIASLPDVISAPFLHFSWAHIEGNSGPLFIFGFLAAYRGVRKFIWVTILIIVTSGLAAWLAEPANTIGAGETSRGHREHGRADLPRHPAGQAGPMSLLLTNIAELVTNDGAAGDRAFAAITDAALVIEAGRVAWTGPASRAPAADQRADCGGRAVLPGFVDSHAHLVFAGERSAEFAARMAGTPYHAGGIATTVAATRAATDEQLRANLGALRREMLGQGITTFECKSGYGLTVADERRSVALAAEVTPEVTFLGAHVVPPEFAANRGGYLDLVCGPMLTACAAQARWVDVFCERGAFGADEARAVLTAGQLGTGPGIQLAVELGAASTDHCTYLTDADVDALAGGGTVATLLPGVEFSTRNPYPDARRLLGAGATVALATDCNPGSCFTSSMPL